MTEKSECGLCKQVMWLTKKGNFDGLHKQLKNGFGENYQKRKLYARKFGKMPEKS